MKEKTVSGRGKIGEPVVFSPYHIGEVFDTQFSPSDLQHRTHQSAHHSTQKPVCLYLINEAGFLLFPGAFLDGTKEGFNLRTALGKGGEILVFEE
jgi:hypothetical protein